MRRTLTAALAAPALAALVLLGGASAAHAGQQHHDTRPAAQPSGHGEHAAGRGKHHAPGCDHKCTPAPTPPPGGWPCQQTHTCKPPKVPHCPPVKHHHPKPPTVHPHPPVVTHPKPVAHHPAPPAAHLSTPAATNQLPYTGANTTASVALGFALIGVGGAASFAGRRRS